MAKIMLVEDDNNLREIYEARLLAEGYEIVAAKDGEEALALAVKEKPDLIISDVMMPKISGFDMLDILRSTAETKNTKVIMMTALSQAEDKSRADKLGADRYLVKSQVTLEDVAKVAHDVLAGIDSAAGATSTPMPTEMSAPSMPVDTPVVTAPAEPATAPVPDPVPEEPVATAPTEPATPAPADPMVTTTPPEPPADPEPAEEPAPAPETPIVDATVPSPEPEASTAPAQPEPETPADPAPEAPEMSGVKNDLTQTTAEEEKAIESQINAIFSEPVDAAAEQATTETPPPDMSGNVSNETPMMPASTEPEPTPDPVVEAPASSGTSIPVTETIEPTEPAVAPAPFEPAQEANPGSVPVMGKKVIQPITDMSTGPSINELLAKEGEGEAVPSAPATSVVSPGGQTVIPVTTDAGPEDTTPHQPGNVIAPGDIAL